MRWFGGIFAMLGVAAAVAGLTTVVPGEGTPAAAASSPGPFQVQVGNDQRVFGPTSLMDTPYFSERDAAGRLRGYISNGQVFEYAGIPPAGLRRRLLGAGPAGQFDQCGAWLLGSVFKRTSTHWIALYHAEQANPADGGRCNPPNHRWSLAYAESLDGGRTWRKDWGGLLARGYPHNQVVTQDAGLLGTATVWSRNQDDAGNGRVVVANGFLYVFYQAKDRTGMLRLHVARSSVSNAGRPGTWRKWYCTNAASPGTCGWSQPGIGGRSTGLRDISAGARYISWNGYLKRWVGVFASGRWGITLWYSRGADPLDWVSRKMLVPRVSESGDQLVDAWDNRNGTHKQVYGYGSIIGLDGNSRLSGREFSIYYMMLHRGDGFDERYLMRRRVSLQLTSAPMDRIQLTTYARADGRRWTTVEAPKRGYGYAVQRSTGYLLTSSRQGWAAVYDCWRPARFDRYLRRGGCGRGDVPLRRAGWISTQRTGQATMPVYGCYDRARDNHFAHNSRACDGKRLDYLLGWALPGFR